VKNITIRSRIAPTPSGFLHIGNAFSFLLTWLIVRKNEGFLYLRIDDLDAARLKVDYLDDIFFTLDWLQLNYDGGASGTADFLQNFSQQHRLSIYENFLEKLKNLGQIYACQCSRKQIREQNEQGIYPKNCRNKGLDFEKNAWRMALPDKINIEINDFFGKKTPDFGQIGDFVVRRKDGLPAYQIGSLCDDLENKINFIVRGQDLWDSTAAQLYLAQISQKTAFMETIFLHHPLFYGQNGQKLSKSAGAISLKEIRKNQSPAFFYQFFAQKIGLNPKIDRLQDLLAAFETEKLRFKNGFYE